MDNKQIDQFFELLMGTNNVHPDYTSNPSIVLNWMREHMPEEWEEYLLHIFSTTWTLKLSDDLFRILDLRNLAQYLLDHPEWGEKECEDNMAAYPDCVRGNCNCHGSGVIVHPALEYAKGEGCKK